MDEEEIKATIAQNIIFYRKAASLTQAELADKLNYSDKAVSKWERAESVPDVLILKKLADIFSVSLDKLTSKHELLLNAKLRRRDNLIRRLTLKNKFIIPLISAGLVWLIATIVFASFFLFGNPNAKSWLAFIYAIPVSTFVLLVFNAIWGVQYLSCILTTVLNWTIMAALFLSIKIKYSYMFFIPGIPLQVLIILWYFLKINPKFVNNKTGSIPKSKEQQE